MLRLQEQRYWDAGTSTWITSDDADTDSISEHSFSAFRCVSTAVLADSAGFLNLCWPFAKERCCDQQPSI